MLHRIDIENYKAILSASLDLDRLTVIVGPNSSGKSSLLEAVNLGCKKNEAEEADMHGDPSIEAVRNTKSRGAIKIRLSWDSGSHTIQFDNRNKLADRSSAILAAQKVARDKAGMPSKLKTLLVKFDTERMAEPSHSFKYPPILTKGGYGLPSVLAYMALNRPDDFQWVQEAVRAIVPSARRIRFDREIDENDPDSRLLDVLVFDMQSGDGIGAKLVSEGTLLTLGLLAAMAGSRDSDLILLIDDLDRGLHPKAQEELVAMLRRFLDENPKAQIVATTHSPILLNFLRPEEVRLTTLNPDGTTACGKLTDHPAFEEWKDAMAPGEFWSYVGEQWVREHEVGGNA